MRLGITGHRGLPAPVAAQVRAALDEFVAARAPAAVGPTKLTAVSNLADGPDSWFARAVLDHGGSLEVVVPAGEYRAGLPTWHHPEYDALYARATAVHRTGLTASTPEAHQTGSEMLVSLVDELVAVWDGRPARGYGGTADVVAHARHLGIPVRIVWPDGATR
ncbi:hypothetical protein [Phaeacidiphilus oryzae]|uniref:hypothetical protein n=1 Tax=Phaeacidiphilus oryzae TaxID=348818 RepID=UPI0005661E84|nr:hypothetical protein [Phaeacidiphilus oryzae]